MAGLSSGPKAKDLNEGTSASCSQTFGQAIVLPHLNQGTDLLEVTSSQVDLTIKDHKCAETHQDSARSSVCDETKTNQAFAVQGKLFSDAIYDACDTPMKTFTYPATVPSILNLEEKICHDIHLMFSKIKGIKDDYLTKLVNQFVDLYRNSFERCVSLLDTECGTETQQSAALRFHLSERLRQWNQWFEDKGIDRTFGRRFKEPNSKNKGCMDELESSGLQKMKENLLEIERTKLAAAEQKKIRCGQQRKRSGSFSGEEGVRKKEEDLKCVSRSDRAREKKKQKEMEELKQNSFNDVDGSAHNNVEILSKYKAKCHSCCYRFTETRYVAVHEKYFHKKIYYCHYCTRTFATHGPLRVHCEQTHTGLPVDPPGRKPPKSLESLDDLPLDCNKAKKDRFSYPRERAIGSVEDTGSNYFEQISTVERPKNNDDGHVLSKASSEYTQVLHPQQLELTCSDTKTVRPEVTRKESAQRTSKWRRRNSSKTNRLHSSFNSKVQNQNIRVGIRNCGLLRQSDSRSNNRKKLRLSCTAPLEQEVYEPSFYTKCTTLDATEELSNVTPCVGERTSVSAISEDLDLCSNTEELYDDLLNASLLFDGEENHEEMYYRSERCVSLPPYGVLPLFDHKDRASSVCGVSTYDHEQYHMLAETSFIAEMETFLNARQEQSRSSNAGKTQEESPSGKECCFKSCSTVHDVDRSSGSHEQKSTQDPGCEFGCSSKAYPKGSPSGCGSHKYFWEDEQSSMSSNEFQSLPEGISNVSSSIRFSNVNENICDSYRRSSWQSTQLRHGTGNVIRGANASFCTTSELTESEIAVPAFSLEKALPSTKADSSLDKSDIKSQGHGTCFSSRELKGSHFHDGRENAYKPFQMEALTLSCGKANSLPRLFLIRYMNGEEEVFVSDNNDPAPPSVKKLLPDLSRVAYYFHPKRCLPLSTVCIEGEPLSLAATDAASTFLKERQSLLSVQRSEEGKNNNGFHFQMESFVPKLKHGESSICETSKPQFKRGRGRPRKRPLKESEMDHHCRKAKKS